MQILLIEDDEIVADFVAKGLREAGHRVTHCADGQSGLFQSAAEPYDLIILDRMLPKVDGLRILQTLRASEDDTPVLILSALGDTDDRVKGLRAGGDDYLTKPFALAELIARVEALSRRRRARGVETRIEIGSLTIDLLGHQVSRGDRRIELTVREFRILECLARNKGRVVTRSMLLEEVWDYAFDPQTNIIDQHVSRLRQKLDRDCDRSIIRTVRGAGYILQEDS